MRARTARRGKIGVVDDDIRYARSGDGYVAYRVRGDGPVDMLCCNETAMVSIDSIPDEPHWDHLERRLASFSRLITFDRSGIGLSDSPRSGDDVAALAQQWGTDARSVLDAVGSERAVVVSLCGGVIALSLCDTAPERVSHLVLLNSHPSAHGVADDPWLRGYEKWLEEVASGAPTESTDDVALLLPSLSGDQRFRRWWAQAGQRGASPRVAAFQTRAVLELDLRHVLPNVHVPALVLWRRDAAFNVAAVGRYMADAIPGARCVELPGNDYFPFAGDADAVADEIEEFLTGARSARPVHRVLATILFSDIVDSTKQAVALGDTEWRARLDAHDAMLQREIDRFSGRMVKSTGDGVLATFDAPGRAIQCARAARAGAGQLGLELRIGIHTGEVELRGDDVGGVGVHIGARVTAIAEPGAVFVSSTVKDLVAGSDFRFVDRGAHELKGVPGTWPLFEVAD